MGRSTRQFLNRQVLASELRRPANQLTAARLMLVPLLWLFAIARADVALGIGLGLAYATDILDGIVARRSGQNSPFGAAFDSLADNILLPSAIVWMILLRPQILQEHPVTCLVAIGIYTTGLAIGWLRFGQIGNLHLYSSKVGSVVLTTFFVHALLSDGYSEFLFRTAAAFFIFSSSETLILQLLLEDVHEHMGSIFRVILDLG